MAMAVRNGITREQMLDMSLVSLLNILISMTNEEVEHKATQSDIDRMFGRWNIATYSISEKSVP